MMRHRGIIAAALAGAALMAVLPVIATRPGWVEVRLGVGTPDDPTPAGEFFVAFDEPPPEPGVGYGPFVLVTSAHSPSIADWEGSGDAVIGIHGPLGMDAAIGTEGARISHGCVRLHLSALDRLSGRDLAIVLGLPLVPVTG
jgi:L,D-transpeptidase catalytic domain